MKVKTRLVEGTLNGLATESTRNIEIKVDELLKKKKLLRQNDRLTLGKKFDLIKQNFIISPEGEEAYYKWSKTRNSYTHGITGAYDAILLKRNYKLIAKELNKVGKGNSKKWILIPIVFAALMIVYCMFHFDLIEIKFNF